MIACQRASSLAKSWLEERSAIMALMICSYWHEFLTMPTLGMEVHPRTPVLAVEFAGLAAKAAAERCRQALPRPFRSSCLLHMPPAAGIRERPPFCPAFGIEA